MFVRSALAIGLLAYLVFSDAIQWPTLLGLSAAWPLTLVAFVILCADTVVTAWRLCVLLKPRGMHLSLNASLRLSLIGLFFNTYLPGASGGDVIKIYYATTGNQGRRTELVTVMILDRVIGMFAMVILPLLIAPFFVPLIRASEVLRALLWLAAAVTTAMILGILFISAEPVRNSRIMSRAFLRLPMGEYAQRVIDTIQTYWREPGTLLATVGISLLAHIMSVAVMLILYVAIRPGEFSWQMSMLIPMGFLVNTIPLTPGGLGVGETAFDSLFALAGLNGGAEMLLSWRILMLSLGLLGLVVYLQGKKHFVSGQLSTQAMGTSPEQP